MITLILLAACLYFGSKEFGRFKKDRHQKYTSKVEREEALNELLRQNLQMQKDLQVLKQGELLQSGQAQALREANPQTEQATTPEQGYRYVTGKKKVQRSQPQTQH